MSEPTSATLLDEALEAWEYTRRGVVDEVSSIPGDEWDFRPHPEARSVSELVRHILESGLMMVGELTRPDGDFRRQAHSAFIEEYSGHLPDDPSPSDLRGLLAESFAEGAAAFRSVGEVHMLQLIRQYNGERGTRLAWLHHGIAHENYHRGQLAAWVRLTDRVPALTRSIQGG